VFPNLPIEPSGSSRRTARVCIATYEILGPSQHGGIGTAYYSLAVTLAAAHHDVTVLYLWAGRSNDSEMRYWENHFRSLGISFVPLPSSPNIAGLPECMLIARDAHAWLRTRQFDVVHFPELHGHGYYCVLAKHQGIDFNQTILCIGTHSPISWIRERNQEAPYSPDELEMEFMERQCVALADVVVSPSQYMLGWLQRRGWALPAQCYVQQNIALDEPRTATLQRMRGALHRARELVFFGRLEARKGIGLFCDALDLLRSRNLPAFSVTFLGKNGRMAGRDAVSYIRARSASWSFPYRIITDYGRDAALQYLAEDTGRVAVIPSFEDNLPYTVLECLAGSIEFLAGRGGGIPELIAHDDVEQVTFPPDAVQLAACLARAIRDGVPMARPAIDVDENKQRWINWHSALAGGYDDRRRTRETVAQVPAQPLVTICLNYRGERELLGQSLESLRRQNYPRLEVILSGCSPAGAEADLHSMERDFESRGWRLILGTESGHNIDQSDAGGARGDYVLVMEASDYLEPEAVTVFVQAATRTGAEVLTCFLALYSGAREPAVERWYGRYPFLGAAIVPGLFRNHFGARVIFVRKETLLQLGGFPGNSRRDCADWEFLARAALMQHRMEVIPLPLVWWRLRDESDLNAPTDYLAQVQALLPYTQAMPAALHDLPKAAFTMGLHYHRMRERLGDSPMHAILQRLSMNHKAVNGAAARTDDGALLLAADQMPARPRRKIASMLDGWLEYSAARSRLPPPGFQRISHIARQLMRGHYHRYGHGFGSALRDLRKPAQSKQHGREN
jgi:glycosyltransferase involved in cell wall biosynthesis